VQVPPADLPRPAIRPATPILPPLMAPQQPSWKQEARPVAHTEPAQKQEARPEAQTEPAQETETKPGPEAAPSDTPGENQ
jgi:hypothetical protein